MTKSEIMKVAGEMYGSEARQKPLHVTFSDIYSTDGIDMTDDDTDVADT
jgi:hypothetical protein